MLNEKLGLMIKHKSFSVLEIMIDVLHLKEKKDIVYSTLTTHLICPIYNKKVNRCLSVYLGIW